MEQFFRSVWQVLISDPVKTLSALISLAAFFVAVSSYRTSRRALRATHYPNIRFKIHVEPDRQRYSNPQKVSPHLVLSWKNLSDARAIIDRISVRLFSGFRNYSWEEKTESELGSNKQGEIGLGEQSLQHTRFAKGLAHLLPDAVTLDSDPDIMGNHGLFLFVRTTCTNLCVPVLIEIRFTPGAYGAEQLSMCVGGTASPGQRDRDDPSIIYTWQFNQREVNAWRLLTWHVRTLPQNIPGRLTKRWSRREERAAHR
jgi:hypothetical protein